MKTMYVVVLNEILKVGVEKETPKYVWINGIKHSKVSKDIKYFDVLEDAKKSIIERNRFKIKQLQDHIASMQREIEYAETITDDRINTFDKYSHLTHSYSIYLDN